MQGIITTSPWIWASLLGGMVLLPVLIHLINRLRHRRVRWAAMEFLLASHRKNRNRVRLRQWLLLLARIVCLVLVLFTIGQIGCNNDNLSRFLGAEVTHHYILVDDSMSMADTQAGKSAMQRAQHALGLIADRISGRQNHRVTLLRFSGASQSSGPAENQPDGPPLMSRLDLNSALVDREFRNRMAAVSDTLIPTFLSTGPQPGLDLVRDLILQRSGQNSLVYLLSDFREKDWAQAQELAGSLDAIRETGAEVQFIRCVESKSQNLAISALRARSSVRVAGVPTMMEVTVVNLGTEPARQVQVRIQSATYPNAAVSEISPANATPEVAGLATILIDEIEPGESVARQFPAYFPTPGQHAIRAAINTDPLEADNANWMVASFATSQKILLIGGSESGSRFVSLALAPGGMTGLEVETADKSLLRDINLERLNQYDSVFLLDVDRLEASAHDQLKQFAELGGGVVFFTGPNTDLKHFTTELYANGEGIFPLPLQRIAAVPEQLDEPASDIVVQKHPIFSAVVDVDFSPLQMVQVQRVCQPPPEWRDTNDPRVNTIATVRGNQRQPLVIEKSLGRGTVLAVTSSAGPSWNNWVRNPTFPATLLLMQEYVSRGRHTYQRFATGSGREFRLAVDAYRTQVEFVRPDDSEEGQGWDRVVIPGTSRQVDGDIIFQTANPQSDQALPGVYEAWFRTSDERFEVRRWAVNPNLEESNLTLATRSGLKEVAGDVGIVDWDRFGPGVQNNRGTTLVRSLLLILLGVLVVEQFLAFWASFHPSTRKTSSPTSRREAARHAWELK